MVEHTDSRASEALFVADNEDSPANWAVLPDLVSLLQDSRVLRTVDADGRNVLHWACSAGHVSNVRAILDVTGELLDVNLAEKGGWTALLIAVSAKHEVIARMLLDDPRTRLDTTTPSGANALHLAVTKCSTGLVEILLDRMPALIRSRDRMQQTALHRAAAAPGRTSFVDLLLQRGAPKDASDATGMTALMHAAAEGNVDSVKSLLHAGANSQAVDQEGRTMLQWVEDGDLRRQIENLLKDI